MNLMFGLPETTGLDRAAGAAVGARRVAAARLVAPRAPALFASTRRGWRCARTCRGRGARSSVVGARSRSSAACGGGASTSARSSAASTARRSRRGSPRSKPRTRQLRTENAAAPRARRSQLESELAMTSGAQATLSKQALELHDRELAAQGGARLPAEARRRLEQAGRARRSSASPSSASATTPGTTACCWCAAAARRTSSRARSRCRRRVQPAAARRRAAAPDRSSTLPDEQPDTARGAEAQIQVLSAA